MPGQRAALTLVSLLVTLTGCVQPPQRVTYTPTQQPPPPPPIRSPSPQYRSVRVNSIPSGAEVYGVFDEDRRIGPHLGKTPCEIDVWVWYDPTFQPTPKYVTRSDACWSMECSDQEWVADRPNQCKVFLNLAVSSPGYRTEKVRRYVGNDIVVIGQFSAPSLRWDGVGEITISLTSDISPSRPEQQQQQQQQQQTVVVPGAGGERESAASTGTIILSANLDGSEVYVDGVFVGNAPANLKLSDGIHIIEVKKSGHQTYKRDLRVIGGSEVALRANLVPN